MDHPGCVWIPCKPFDALFLGITRQVIPKLYQLDPITGNESLEVPNLSDPLLDFCALGVLPHEELKKRPIPGAKHYPRSTLGRQMLPISPQEWIVLFFFARRPESERADMTRVHPLVNEIDGCALARAVEPGHNDEQAAVSLAQQRVLGLEQLAAQLCNQRFGGVLGNAGVTFRFCKARYVRRHGVS